VSHVPGIAGSYQIGIAYQIFSLCLAVIEKHTKVCIEITAYFEGKNNIKKIFDMN